MPQRIDVPGMGIVEFPDGMSDDQITAAIKQNMAPSVGEDVTQSAISAIPKGLINAAGQPADTNSLNKRIGSYLGDKLGISPDTQSRIGQGYDLAAQSGMLGPMAKLGMLTPGAQQIRGAVERNVTGPLYEGKTVPGRIAGGAVEAAANPLSYVGPGGAALKIGGALASGAGSEAAGEAAQGTGYELPARIVGGLAGGTAAAKALGPKQAIAAVPTRAELRAASDLDYTAARNSGVEFDPRGIAQWAAQQQQDLTTGPKYAFTGGTHGTAPKALNLLDELQSPPSGAVSTAANLDTIRRRINDIASETVPGGPGGTPKPTPDAKAAMVLKRSFADFFENPPPNTVVAGNAADFATPLKRANANAAAGFRVGDIEHRINNAQVNTEGSIAANLANQVKSQFRPILKNPKLQRGFTAEELDAIRGVNKGRVLANTLNQVGRGGAGVMPIIAQLAAAPGVFALGGPVGLAGQAGVAAALYGARKAGERMTLNQATALAEMLAKRSPEYERRAASIPQIDTGPRNAALARALMTGASQ